MEQVCHRCGTSLQGAEPFCPHCGAPQLRYEAPEEPVAAVTSGPAQRLAGRPLHSLAGRDAVLAAAALAVPAGILSGLLGLVALWMLAGGIGTIVLYHKRTGVPPMGGLSWRLGILFGFFAAAVATAVNAITLVVQRYLLHQGAMLDGRYRELGQQLTDQLLRSNPDAKALLPGFMHFWLTPDGAAAMVLMNAVGVVISMLLFAAAGGALGARLGARAAHSNAR